jgi:hypothetical protein
MQHLPAQHIRQRFFGFQDRQRAIQAARIDFLMKFHGRDSQYDSVMHCLSDARRCAMKIILP